MNIDQVRSLARSRTLASQNMKQVDQHRLDERSGYGVALVPSPKVCKALIAFQASARAIIQLGPPLGLTVNRPHLTLYQGYFRRDLPVPEVIGDLAVILRAATPEPRVAFDHIVYKARGWYFLLVKRDPWLAGIHDATVRRVAEYIRLRSTATADLDDYSKGEKKSYRVYGYRYVGAAFLPHITLGRSLESDGCTGACELTKLWESAYSLRYAPMCSITFYRMGQNGMHRDTIHEVVVA